MAPSTWDGVLRSRIRRRRALAATGLFSSGALLLAACGGGNSDREVVDRGLLTPLEDTSSKAQRGGTLHSNIANTVSLDPITGLHGGFKVQNSPLFNRLFQGVPGILEPSDGEITGDAAESWEMSPDGLQLTIRLRHNLGTDPRPPVNGRMLTAEDVLWSWNLFAAQSTVRATMVNSVDPNSPVTGVRAPDNRTIVYSLAAPSTLLLGYLTDGFYFWIIPSEAETQYDRRNEAHGAGPWFNERFEPDVGFRMRRNPNYYDSRLPYYDGIEVVVLTEPAALLAQFEAARIDISSTIYANAGITNDNVLEVHQRHPSTTLFAVPSPSAGRHLWVGYADHSPFRDIRMRKALSMSMHRDDLAEHFTSAIKMTQMGVPTEPTIVSHLAPFYPGAADLRDRVFDRSRAHFEYNPTEARALIRAAGREGENIDVMYSSGQERDGNVMAEQVRQSGQPVTERVLDINQEFVPMVTRARGNHAFVAMHTLLQGYTSAHFVYTNLHPTPETTAIRSRNDFPELTNLADSILKEFDNERRDELARQWMIQAAVDLPTIPVGATGPAYNLAWPWVANAGVFERWLGSSVNNVEVFRHYWYDQSKGTRPS
jgi:ABC-type transport system substrate-binding protein